MDGELTWAGEAGQVNWSYRLPGPLIAAEELGVVDAIGGAAVSGLPWIAGISVGKEGIESKSSKSPNDSKQLKSSNSMDGSTNESKL